MAMGLDSAIKIPGEVMGRPALPNKKDRVLGYKKTYREKHAAQLREAGWIYYWSKKAQKKELTLYGRQEVLEERSKGEGRKGSPQTSQPCFWV